MGPLALWLPGAPTPAKHRAHTLHSTQEIHLLPSKSELAASFLITFPHVMGNIALCWLMTA